MPQTTVFVWILLQICSDDNKYMNDNDKHVAMIANVRYIVTKDQIAMHAHY